MSGNAGSSDCGTNTAVTQPPAPSEQDAGDIAKELLGEMPTCSQGEFSAKMSLGFLASARVSGSFSTGCEQISAMVNQYNSTKSVLNCVVNSHKTTQDASATTVHSITFRNFGNVGGNVQLLNIARTVLFITGTLSTQEVSQIKSAVEDTAHAVMDAVQTSNKAQTSNTQGQKSVQVAKTSISSRLNSTNVTEIITTQFASAHVNENIVMDNYGSVAGDVVLTNNSVIEITVSNMVKAAMDYALDSEAVTDFLIEVRNNQKATSTTIEGTEMMYIAIAVVFVALAVVGIALAVKAANKKDTTPAHRKSRSKHDGKKEKQTSPSVDAD
jgi:hypothetical protein